MGGTENSETNPDRGDWAARETVPFHDGRETLHGFDPPEIPGFEDLTEIGRGGMGVVYRARQVDLDRIVALKMIRSGRFATAEDVIRFHTEARSIAQLDHPGIVPIHDFGEHEGRPYFSMAYVDGPSLQDELLQGPLPVARAARLTRIVAESIAYAHGRGVIHRDLKPANILLGSGDEPRITDFGLAKRIEADTGVTGSGQILGTPGYLSPEQVGERYGPVSESADIYALGAILYTLLVGHPPFQTGRSLDALLEVLDRDPVSPRRINPKLPRDFETICLKCLEKEPRRRYARAQDLADELERALEGKPIEARPLGPGTRLGRWCRRKPLPASLAAALVAALAFGMIGIVSQWHRAQENAHRETRARGQAERARQEAEVAKSEALQRLWQSYLNLARAGRWSRQPGRRFESLEVLARAAAIRKTHELRDAAIAALTWTDASVRRRWPGFPQGTTVVAFDRSLAFLARGEESGTVRIFQFGSNEEVATLPGSGVAVWTLLFSPDGRYLAARFDDERVRLWRWEEADLVAEIDGGSEGLAFDPAGRVLAVGGLDRSIRRFDLESGGEPRRQEAGSVPLAIRFHPTKPWLAYSGESGEVRVVDLEDDGRVLASLLHSDIVPGLAWHPEGRWLATASHDEHIRMWDLQAPASPIWRKKVPGPARQVAFNHRGDLLASNGWPYTLRLWRVDSGDLLLEQPIGNEITHFGPDDRWLAFVRDGSDLGLWEVAYGDACRVLAAGPASGGDSVSYGVDFSPDGRWIATASDDGVRLWDVVRGRPVAVLPGGQVRSVFFSPDGRDLYACGFEGLVRWPIVAGEDAAEFVIGPPRPVGPGGGSFERLDMTPDGKRMAFVHRRSNRPFFLDRDGGELQRLGGVHLNVVFIAIAPDGRWIATGTWQGEGVKVWDTETGEEVRHLDVRGNANVAFSPDGRRLVTTSSEGYRTWRVGTWEEVIEIPLPGPAGRPVAFTRDGRWMAITSGSSEVRLIEVESGKELARLLSPHDELIQWLRFSPDDGRLAVAVDARTVLLWDLRHIRRNLRPMGLDWDGPAFPPAPSGAGEAPARVRVIGE